MQKVKGYVVGYDVKEGSIVWTVKVRDDSSPENGKKFPVASMGFGKMLSKPGVDVTFQLKPVGSSSVRVMSAVNVVVTDAANGLRELSLDQAEYNFKLEPDGLKIILRVIQPSPRYGGWPGNTVTIHEWKILPKGKSVYVNCAKGDVIQLERMFGVWEEVRFIIHPTLGEVACEG